MTTSVDHPVTVFAITTRTVPMTNAAIAMAIVHRIVLISPLEASLLQSAVV